MNDLLMEILQAREDRAANYHADTLGTEVIYNSLSDAICQVRACAAPLSAEWKQKVDEDYRKRSGRSNNKWIFKIIINKKSLN